MPASAASRLVWPGRSARRRALVLTALLALVASAVALVVPTQIAGAETANGPGRVWLIDAVDDDDGSRWVSQDNGTSTVTIEIGDTVEWTFDRAGLEHDLTSLDTGTVWDEPIQRYFFPGEASFLQTFDKPGIYYYECTLHNTEMTGVIIVEDPSGNRAPTGSATVGPQQGPAPLDAHFVAAGFTDPDGDLLDYSWDFGTGDPADTSDLAHAMFRYSTPGSYAARLTVSDGNGGVYTQRFPIEVTDPQAPTVSVSATPTSGQAPLQVAFQGEASSARPPLRYHWDFGVPGADDVASTPNASFSYTVPGSYTAALTVTDNDGHHTRRTVPITVAGAGHSTLPGLQARADRVSGAAPLSVGLSAEVATGGTFLPYADGLSTYPDLTGTATMTRARGRTEATLDVVGLAPGRGHLVHVHDQPCSVSRAGAHFRFDSSRPFEEANELWLPFTTDAQGRSGQVRVSQPMRANADAVSIVIHDPDNPALRIGCVDLAPDLSDIEYSWSFGDGRTGSGPDPRHTYAAPGTYRATVTLTRTGGHAGHGGHGAPAPAQQTSATVTVVVAAAPTSTVRRDTTVPSVRSLAPTRNTRQRRPTLRATIKDASGVRAARIKVTVDGRSAVRVRYRAATGKLTAVPRQRLKPGRHTVKVVAVDNSGNCTVKTWRFRVRR